MGTLLTVLACLLVSVPPTLADPADPSIRFISVPDFGSDGDLLGRAENVDVTNCALAVYIFVNGWWTKPSWAEPLTAIDTNGDWMCDITTAGTDSNATAIAAFVIPLSYSPPAGAGEPQLPLELESNSVAWATWTRYPPPHISFSGYAWSVKDTGDATWGPGPNHFSSRSTNVWVDADGRLHLRITHDGDRWHCAEVVSHQSFGYGTYRVFIDTDFAPLDPNVVFGAFVWSDDAAYAYREMDIEMTRWGNPTDTNILQYTVQPWDLPDHTVRFPMASTPLTTHSMTWYSNRIDYISHLGHFTLPHASNTVMAEWTFHDPGVPHPRGENYRMNLWLVQGHPPLDLQEAEVVISRFAFIPEVLEEPDLSAIELVPPSSYRLSSQAEPQVTYQLESTTNLAEAQWNTEFAIVPTNAQLDFTGNLDPSAPQKAYRMVIPPQR